MRLNKLWHIIQQNIMQIFKKNEADLYILIQNNSLRYIAKFKKNKGPEKYFALLPLACEKINKYKYVFACIHREYVWKLASVTACEERKIMTKTKARANKTIRNCVFVCMYTHIQKKETLKVLTKCLLWFSLYCKSMSDFSLLCSVLS